MQNNIFSHKLSFNRTTKPQNIRAQPTEILPKKKQNTNNMSKALEICGTQQTRVEHIIYIFRKKQFPLFYRNGGLDICGRRLSLLQPILSGYRTLRYVVCKHPRHDRRRLSGDAGFT